MMTLTGRTNAVQISYDDVGRGEPTLLFMNGWGANRTIWNRVVPQLSPNRRVLALDWRGHGQSATPAGDFGASDLVEDALAVLSASGVEQIVPVANAHAGWIAIELRRQLGERIPKLVLVDWIITEAPPPFLAVLEAFQDPTRWEQARDQLIASWLHDAVDPEEISFIRHQMGSVGFDMWARAGRAISSAYAAAGSPLQALAALNPPVPTIHLYATPNDPGYLHTQQVFAAAHSWFQVRKLDAHGHFPMIAAWQEVATAIERFMVGGR